MLARHNRLTKKEEFEAVREQGKVLQSESFFFSYYKRDDDNPSRFGFVVTKKISPHATARNKAVRSMREGVRQTVSYVKPGYDIVMVAKPIIIRKYTSDLMREVDLILQKTKLLQMK
jgi:ribonuclease P protein component